MDTIIVYFDDASFAKQQLASLASDSLETQWVLVGCAPRMTHRIGKWLSHSARMGWREQWASKAFAQVLPILRNNSNKVETLLATGSLQDMTDKLRKEWGAARVVDARRPKFGVVFEPVVKGIGQEKQAWQIPGAVMGMSAVLAIAGD